MLQTSVLSLLLAVQITAEMLKAKEHLDSSPLGTWCSNGCQGKHMTIQLSCPSFRESSPMPWRRKWQLTPVFLPGKLHSWRSLVDCSPSSHKESDMAEWLSVSTCTSDGLIQIDIMHPSLQTKASQHWLESWGMHHSDMFSVCNKNNTECFGCLK